MADEERFDGLLLNVARNTAGIDDLLDVFLGFLRRKTDAFDPPGGFAQLEKAFVAALRRQYDTAQARKRGAGGKPKPVAAAAAAAAAQAAPRAPARPVAGADKAEAAGEAAAGGASGDGEDGDEDVLEMGADGSFDVSRAGRKQLTPLATPASAGVASGAARAGAVAARGAAAPAAAKPAAAAAKPAGAAVATAPAPTGGGATATAAAPPPTAPAANAAAGSADGPAPVGNGGTTDRYAWTQTLSELTVTFAVPPGVTARDVTVDFKPASLKARAKCAPAGEGGQEAVGVPRPRSPTTPPPPPLSFPPLLTARR